MKSEQEGDMEGERQRGTRRTEIEEGEKRVREGNRGDRREEEIREEENREERE